VRCAAHQFCYIRSTPCRNLHALSSWSMLLSNCPRHPLLLVCGTEGLRGIHLFLRQQRRLYRRVMSSLVLGEAPWGGSVSPRPVPSVQTTKRVCCGPGFRATQGRELCITSRLPAVWNLRPNNSCWDHFGHFCVCVTAFLSGTGRG
jgi:hypothetical protein